jgi:hypothetical protein
MVASTPHITSGRSGMIDPVVQPGPSSTGQPLRRQQPLAAHQPQHPVAAHPDVVLAPQPSPDLAVAFPDERAVGDHRADQPHHVLVADAGLRPALARPRRAGRPDAAGVHGRARASSTRHTVASGNASAALTSAASWAGSEAPFSGRRPQDLVLHRELTDLALRLRSRRSSGANGCAFSPSTPPAKNSSRHAARRCASTRSSRLTSSRPSPPSNRITASALRFADHRTSRGRSASATPTLPISIQDSVLGCPRRPGAVEQHRRGLRRRRPRPGRRRPRLGEVAGAAPLDCGREGRARGRSGDGARRGGRRTRRRLPGRRPHRRGRRRRA